MIQFIGDHCILGPEQGFKQPCIGIETGGIENGRFSANKGTEVIFQLFVNGLGATDKAHRCQAIAPLFQATYSCRLDLRMLSQPQIIVGTEIEHWRAAIH